MIDKSTIDAIATLAPTPMVDSLGGRQVILTPVGEGKFAATIESDLALRDALAKRKMEEAEDRGHPPTLTVTTLTSFYTWLDGNIEDVALASLTVHVVSPTRVEAFLTPDPLNRRRLVIVADCTVFTPTLEFAGKRYDLEAFNVLLQSNFAPTDQRAAVLKIAGNATESTARTMADTGVAQQITVKTSLGPLENTEVPNPVWLEPFRTFREVQQPDSPFVFRLYGGKDGEAKPQASLHEADGAQWKHTAMRRVQTFLQACLPSVQILA